MKNNKGITLIALVITIIVLLILAGVSIAMLTGENGILTQAGNAKTQTNRAEALERVNMELNGQLANAMAGTAFDAETDIEENLANMPKGYEVEVSVSGAGTYATTASVSITLTGEGVSTEAGEVKYEGGKWKVIPVVASTTTQEPSDDENNSVGG